MEHSGHPPEWSGQRVECTNARGRHIYCAAFKTWIVEQALKPGVSMAGLAMRNQINANQLRRWVGLHRTGELMPLARLLPVAVEREPLQPAVAGLSASAIEIGADHTDMRKGFDGPSAMVRTALAANPFCGHVFVFRGRRGDMLKVLWFDGQGLLLLAKRLERGRFVWPQAHSGKVSLTPAQLSMLPEGIDWRMPTRTDQPSLAA
jgi:transposase